MSELAERLEALRSRNDAPLPADTPIYTDAEAKERFLAALEEGKTVQEAAALAGRTPRWFRKFRNTKSFSYDVDFMNAYDEIMAPDGANREGLGQRAFTALVKACEEGNVRAAEKILAAYHSDFHWLRPAVMQGDVNIENFVQLMPGIPTELLQQMREALLAQKQKELPVIDAE